MIQTLSIENIMFQIDYQETSLNMKIETKVKP